MNVLLVKLSSLGDIVHTLPAVQDAAQRGARFDWVVEENYRAVPELVAGVDNVLPVALRRWRTAPLAYAGEVRRFLRRLRRRSYDLVLDAQGLVKSAALTRWARARERAGFDAASARERLASLAYGHRLAVGRREHAIVRIRRLFANVLGYPPPRDAPVFGLPVVHQGGGDLVLAHGASWPNKLWPERFWMRLAQQAAAAGMRPLLPWLGPERARAERIAAAVAEAAVCPPMNMADALQRVARARAVVGVDSGLAHFAAAAGRPTVMVFGPTDPRLTGCQGARARNLSASFACAPCLARGCRYRGRGDQRASPCLDDVPPERVWRALTELLADQRVNP